MQSAADRAVRREAAMELRVDWLPAHGEKKLETDFGPRPISC